MITVRRIRPARGRRLAAVVSAAALAGLALTATASPATAGACPGGLPLPAATYIPPSAPLAPLSVVTGGVTCPLSGATANRMLEYTFSTPFVRPNASGFGVPKVPVPKARIILPDGYFSPGNANKHYPVLYLLHGGGIQYGPTGAASFQDWTQDDVNPNAAPNPAPDKEQGRAFGRVQANAQANSGLIVVMPEGGNVGLYSDWTYANSHRDSNGIGSPMYESFHIKQLIPWVDANFRTKDTAAGRAIAGVSMGGLGSIYYAEQYPGLFSVIGSFSGTLDIQDTGYGPVKPRPPIPAIYSGALGLEQSGDMNTVYGPSWIGSPLYVGAGANWIKHNPIDYSNISLLNGKDLTVTVGASDTTKPLNDRRHCEFTTANPALTALAVGETGDCVVNEEFNKRVLGSGNLLSFYSYQEIQGQLHTWTNWNSRLQDWLPHVMQNLTTAS